MIHHLLAPSLLTIHSWNSSHHTPTNNQQPTSPSFKKFLLIALQYFYFSCDRRGIKCISLFLFSSIFSRFFFASTFLFSSPLRWYALLFIHVCASPLIHRPPLSLLDLLHIHSLRQPNGGIIYYKHKIYFGYLNSELWNVKRSRVSFFNFPDGTDSSKRSVRTRRVARAENNSISRLYKLSNLYVKNTFTSERTSCMSNQISATINVNFDRLLATIYWLDYMHKMFMTGSSSGIRRKLW